MTHPQVDERFSDWVDGRMTARDRERFEAEMRVNPGLRERAERFRRTVEDVQQALRSPLAGAAPPGLADRVMAALSRGSPAPPATLSPWRGASARALLLSGVLAASVVGMVTLLSEWRPREPATADSAAAPAASREQAGGQAGEKATGLAAPGRDQGARPAQEPEVSLDANPQERADLQLGAGLQRQEPTGQPAAEEPAAKSEPPAPDPAPESKREALRAAEGLVAEGESARRARAGDRGRGTGLPAPGAAAPPGAPVPPPAAKSAAAEAREQERLVRRLLATASTSASTVPQIRLRRPVAGRDDAPVAEQGAQTSTVRARQAGPETGGGGQAGGGQRPGATGLPARILGVPIARQLIVRSLTADPAAVAGNWNPAQPPAERPQPDAPADRSADPSADPPPDRSADLRRGFADFEAGAPAGAWLVEGTADEVGDLLRQLADRARGGGYELAFGEVPAEAVSLLAAARQGRLADEDRVGAASSAPVRSEQRETAPAPTPPSPAGPATPGPTGGGPPASGTARPAARVRVVIVVEGEAGSGR